MVGVMTPPKCIFCENELTPDTKPEHILLNALGGRKTTRRAICSACNNTFGGTIDDALTKQVQVLRNLLQLESGTGRPPPMLKRIQAGSDIINVRADGTPEYVRPPFTVTDLPNGTKDVRIQVGSEEELRKIMPHLVARLGLDEAELAKQLASQGQGVRIEERPAPIHFPISLGNEQLLRSVTKSCLVLLSTVVPTEVLRGAPFAAARDFVLNGGDAFLKTKIQIDSRDLPGSEELQARFGKFFNLLYISSDKTGRVVGHFTIYNIISWQIVLAEEDGPPDETGALASNPLDPVQWSDDAATLPPLPFDWLTVEDRTYELQRAKARFERMVLQHVKQSSDSEMERIIADVFDKRGIQDGQPISDPATRQAIKEELSARLAAHALGLDHHEQLDADAISKLFQNKKTT